MSIESLPIEGREALRSLLDIRNPGDSWAAYYALEHPAAKIKIWVHRSSEGRLDGFLIRAQTGQDLFRPLVTLRAPGSTSAVGLIQAAFPTSAPALYAIPEALGLWVLPVLSADPPRRVLLFRLNPARLEMVLNILVTRSASPDGLPRYEIRNGEQLFAAAGVNWQSSVWAEIFVQTDPAVRERGYGKSVCAALCRELLEKKKEILYAVEDNNAASLRLAQRLGFEDTGERELLFAGSVLSPTS
jgi:RimJ/RimL family protein N-acetyltransferase